MYIYIDTNGSKKDFVNMSYTPYGRPGFQMSCFNVNKMRMRQRLDDLNRQDNSASQVHVLKSELAKLKSEHSMEFERTRKQLSQALGIIENNHKTINELTQSNANCNLIKNSQQSQDVRRTVFKDKFENQSNERNTFEYNNGEDDDESEHSFDQKRRIVGDFNRRSNEKDGHRVVNSNPNPVFTVNNHQKSGKKISFAQPSSRSIRTSKRSKEKRYESEDENSGKDDGRDEYDGKGFDQVDRIADKESSSEYESNEDGDYDESYESDNLYSEEDDQEEIKKYISKKHRKIKKNNREKDSRKLQFR